MTTNGKHEKAVQVANIITGTKKHLPNGNQSITIAGATMTVDQATAKMQTFVDNRDAVETAQATASAKVAAEQAQAPSLLAFIAAFVTFIRLTFGESADVLGDFDIPPPKVRTPMTAEQKAVAAAKRVDPAKDDDVEDLYLVVVGLEAGGDHAGAEAVRRVMRQAGTAHISSAIMLRWVDLDAKKGGARGFTPWHATTR